MNKYQRLLMNSIIFGGAMIFILATAPKATPRPKVGVIMPIEHAAIEEIEDGLRDKVRELYGIKVEVVTKNAQGDAQMMRNIMQQMIEKQFAVLMPIGTSTAQMALSLHAETPIVALAAKITKEEAKDNNIFVIQEEISTKTHVEFLQELVSPQHITLVISNAEKAFQEAEELTKALKSSGVKVDNVVVANLSELHSAVQNIQPTTDAIVILKDHLIVSAVETIAQKAYELQVPIVASDEGSVQKGATIALGVKERSIGEAGGEILHKVLEHTFTEEDLFTDVSVSASLFVNNKALTQSKLDVAKIAEVARKMNLVTNYVQTTR